MVLLIVFVFSGGMNSDTADLSLRRDLRSPPAGPRLPAARMQQIWPGCRPGSQATYDAGYASLPPQGVFDSPAAAIVKNDPMYVISPDGTVLAAAPAECKKPGGQDVHARPRTWPAVMKFSTTPCSWTSIQPCVGDHAGWELSDGCAGPQSTGRRAAGAVIVVTVKAPPAR